MVKPKSTKETTGDWMREEMERIDRTNPVVATRYYVTEDTPSRQVRVGDGHGGSDLEWTAATGVKVSPYFNSKDKAKGWKNKHEADEGKHLNIRREKGRQYIHWGPGVVV